MTDVGDGFCKPCVKISGLLDSSQKIIREPTYTCESWTHVVARVSAFSKDLSENEFESQLKETGKRLIISSLRKKLATETPGVFSLRQHRR